MKKNLFIFLLTLLTSILISYDLEQQVETSKAFAYPKGRCPARNKDVPYYEFIIDPINLGYSDYDYMPGSYNAIPLKVQPPSSSPYGFTAGGVYLVYHTKETGGSNRRIKFAYFDHEGNLLSQDFIGDADIWEGYAGIDIDPVTADPLVAWHQNDGSFYDVYYTYDPFHVSGESNSWNDLTLLIDNPYDLINPDDEFMWPYIFVGPSPNAEARRVYVYANNNGNNTPSGNFSENILFGYADFTTLDLSSFNDLNWTFTTIPLLDQWHNEDPWIRPFKACCVSDDGKVAFMGYNTENEIFVFLNENYGEGDFEYFSEDYRFYIDNPMNESETEYTFVDDDGEPFELYFTIHHSGHMNAIFSEDDTKIKFPGCMGLRATETDVWNNAIFWEYAFYPKVFTYDIVENEFSFIDLDLTGVNPDDDLPMIPWDLDENGEVDEFDEDGNVVWQNSWPIYIYDFDVAFHDNYFKIVKNEENNWLAAVWSDGLKSKLGNSGDDDYEEWLECPEIAISISNDNGNEWSEPIFLNSIETPELTGMIPEYIYPGSLIEDMGDGFGKLHLFFIDDWYLGSSIYSFPPPGCWLEYAALKIDFNYNVSAEETDINIENSEIYSYPNPFSSSTTISFQISNEQNQQNEQMIIEIYNIKGQKVRILECFNYFEAKATESLSHITWNGTDDSNKPVSSGIYFYKIKSDSFESSTKKMIILR